MTDAHTSHAVLISELQETRVTLQIVLDESAGFQMRIKKLEGALLGIISHHTSLNTKAGRSVERSTTIRIAVEALKEEL